MSEREFLSVLDNMLEEKMEKVLDKVLDEKLDKMLDEKLDRILDEKLDKKLDEKLDKKLDEKLKPINDRLKRVEMTLDHNVVPRLQNIEECYLTTYKRYQKSVDDYEGMKQDIDVLKKVVESHSEKLQKIS